MEKKDMWCSKCKSKSLTFINFDHKMKREHYECRDCGHKGGQFDSKRWVEKK